ncbi:MAG: DUF2760 domain-containing protein [Bacteroidota bacterium]
MSSSSFVAPAVLVAVLFNAALVAGVIIIGGVTNVAAAVGIGAVASLILGFVLGKMADGRIEAAKTPAVIEPAPQAPAPKEVAPAPPPKPTFAYESSALQLLSILQRKGRLIDFLQEDIRPFQDAQIGAAVRNVHEGCKAAIEEYFELAPVASEAEGGPITVPAGFDAHAYRLVGTVQGNPPFSGTLRHRGWQVSSISLPERTDAGDQDRIVQPAEVAVG